MPVFKLFYRIVNRNKAAFILYAAIFFVLMLAFTQFGESATANAYLNEEILVGIVDKDQSPVSKALSEYLATDCQIVPIKETEEGMQDQLFYRELEYILFIPKGYEESLLNGKESMLDNVKIPDSYTGSLVDMRINSFIDSLNVYLNNGEELNSALKKTSAAVTVSSEVKISDETGATIGTPNYMYYYNYFGYIIVIIAILGFGIVLQQLNRREIQRRTKSSGISIGDYTFQLNAACITFSLGIWVILNVVPLIMYHGNDNQFMDKYVWLLMNTFAATSVAAALGILIGRLVKSNGSMVNGAANTFSLGFAFLGGIFVPQELMNANLLVFAKIIPSYWFVKANKVIQNTAMSTDKDIKTFFASFSVQMLFAITLLCIVLVINKMKTKEA